MKQIKLKSCHRESKYRGAHQPDFIEQEKLSPTKRYKIVEIEKLNG